MSFHIKVTGRQLDEFTPRVREQNPGGRTQQDITDYRIETGRGLADIRAIYETDAATSGANRAARRQGLQDQLAFGLEGQELDRELLGLGREGLILDRRDSVEAAINNALQRGIYQSGIRVRNVARAEERADLQGRGLDVTGKRIDLSEEALRARIQNSLDALKTGAANAKAADFRMREDLEAYEAFRREQERIDTESRGGVFVPAAPPRRQPI